MWTFPPGEAGAINSIAARSDDSVVAHSSPAAVALAVIAAGALVLPARAGAPVPGAGACSLFPADNVWDADISALPVNAHSAAWMASMNAAATNLHPDFGPSFGAQPVPYGIPYAVVTDAQPKVPVSFQYAGESDPGPYPFSASTPIEGGQGASGDRHALMVDATSCTLYELFDARYSASGSTAGSGAIWNLRSDALRPAGWTSADAAGLPILPGLVRLDEVQAGSVSHAIRFTAARTDQRYLWPARHEAGSASNPNLPPMGARFRLKASFGITGFLPETQAILRAMQRYGLILADNGSNWYFQGTDDAGWPNAVLDQLKSVPASAFEAVDESSLMVNPDSGQVRAGAPPSPALPHTAPAPPPPSPTHAASPRVVPPIPAPAVGPATPVPGSPSAGSSPTPGPGRAPSPEPGRAPAAPVRRPGPRGAGAAAALIGGAAALVLASGLVVYGRRRRATRR